MRKVIEVRNLYKLYRVGDEFVRALDGVDFEIYEGEFCAIVGTSGSGKSTLLNMLAGLEKPTKGEVIIAGKHIEKLNEEQLVTFRRDHVGFIFQSFHLMGTLNAVENVALPLSFRGVPRDVRVRKANEMLDLVKLGKHKKHLPNQMSGGQQQRVALARMMIGEPEAILLDEPFSALDGYLKDVLQREMQDFLKDYPGDMILVTHSRDEAYKFCRELSIVHEGRILVTGETKQLFERPGLLEAAKLTGCKNFSRAERLGPHEIYAADWKMKLHTEENVDEDITYVGIRGHWIRPESKPGENCMAVRVDQYIETTFEHQYMIRNKAEENAAGLWWMRPKNSFTEDPDKDFPEYLYLPPEHLMLLK